MPLFSALLLGDELFAEQQRWAPDGHEQLILHENDNTFTEMSIDFIFLLP